MKLNVIADTISTYLTLASSLLLPVLLCVWIRSYLVSDRLYQAESGRAMVVRISNGELAMYTGPIDPRVRVSEHRSREASWGWSNRQTFQRIAGNDYIWLIGFGYVNAQRLPWRNMGTTGNVMGIAVPLWFFVLIVAALPMRLLARNMQTSEEFLAQRAAEEDAAAEHAPSP